MGTKDWLKFSCEETNLKQLFRYGGTSTLARIYDVWCRPHNVCSRQFLCGHGLCTSQCVGSSVVRGLWKFVPTQGKGKCLLRSLNLTHMWSPITSIYTL